MCVQSADILLAGLAAHVTKWMGIKYKHTIWGIQTSTYGPNAANSNRKPVVLLFWHCNAHSECLFENADPCRPVKYWYWHICGSIGPTNGHVPTAEHMKVTQISMEPQQLVCVALAGWFTGLLLALTVSSRIW